MDEPRYVAESFMRQTLRHRVFDARDNILLDRLDKFILTAEAAIDIPDWHAGGVSHRRHREDVDAAPSQDFLRGLYDPGERCAGPPLLPPEYLARCVARRETCRWVHLSACCH